MDLFTRQVPFSVEPHRQVLPQLGHLHRQMVRFAITRRQQNAIRFYGGLPPNSREMLE